MTALNTAVSSSFQRGVKQEINLFYTQEAGVRDRRTGVRILVGDFLIHKHVKTDYWAQTVQWVGPYRCSWEVKRSGRDVDY